MYEKRAYENANEAWEEIYLGLNNCPRFECSPRGLKIRETLCADIVITNPMDNLVYNEFRLASPYYIAQEYYWYLSGNNNVEEASKMSKFWNKIANDDGTVNSNYGKYMFKDLEPDKDNIPNTQWNNIIQILKDDPDSRKALIQLPIAGTKYTKDTVCTSSFQFIIREDRLYMTTYMRSNDLMKGFTNDIPFFTSMQIKLAQELGVELGWYRHVVGSLHIYESDFIENSNKVFMKSGKRFGFVYPYTVKEYDFEHDYNILKDRKKEGLHNPALKYMADNFDNKPKKKR